MYYGLIENNVLLLVKYGISFQHYIYNVMSFYYTCEKVIESILILYLMIFEKKMLDDNCKCNTSHQNGQSHIENSNLVLKELKRSYDEEHIKNALKKLVIYVIFLIVIYIITYGVYPPMSYYFTEIIELIFIKKTLHKGDKEFNFMTISTIDETWQYLETVLVDGLYWEENKNHDLPGIYDNPDNKKLMYENKLLGTARFRQVRVQSDSCVIYSDFKKHFHQCFSDYTTYNEDTSVFGPGIGSQWTYLTADKMNSSSYWGYFSTYSGGGYYIDLPLTKTKALSTIMSLKSHTWLDRATRGFFVDFTFYNANTNLFCVVKLVFEKTPIGSVRTQRSIDTINLILYVDAYDYIVLAFEVIFLILVFYYTVLEIIELNHSRLYYFNNFWNVLNLTTIIISYGVILFEIYIYTYLKKRLHASINKPDEFLDLEEMGSTKVKVRSTLGILVFLMWINLFKYLNFNITMTQLSLTLRKSSKDVASFALMFFIVFFAYSQLGVLLFGFQILEFSTVGFSMITLLQMIVGQYDYWEMAHAQAILAPIFFVTYIVFILFVLVNMFLAIITEAYTKVKNEMSPSNIYINIWENVHRLFVKYFPCLMELKQKITTNSRCLMYSQRNINQQRYNQANAGNVMQIREAKDQNGKCKCDHILVSKAEIERLKTCIIESKLSINKISNKLEEEYNKLEMILTTECNST